MDEYMEVTAWKGILGNWEYKDNVLIYKSHQDKLAQSFPAAHEPYGICISNEIFDEGSIRFSVEQTGHAEGKLLLGFKSVKDKYVIAGLGGYGFAYSTATYFPDYGWSAFAVAGIREDIKPNVRYNVEVKLNGQRIRLFVDEVLVIDDKMPDPLPVGQVGFFVWGKEETQFYGIQIKKRKPKVFVIMEFSEKYDNLYNDVIKPVFNEFNLEAYHVGEVFGPGLILNDIHTGIIEAKIVLADITPTNENVFYELGYSHALGKPTILIAEKGKKLPFDTAPYRCLFYEDTIAGKNKAEASLREHIKAILRNPIAD